MAPANLKAAPGPGATAGDTGYAVLAMLAALHIDLVEELLASGRPPQAIRRARAALT